MLISLKPTNEVFCCVTLYYILDVLIVQPQVLLDLLLVLLSLYHVILAILKL